MQAWKVVHGSWDSKDGALRQNGDGGASVALIEASHWGDGELTLKARKISGKEGFLIVYQTETEEQIRCWNLGGWNNTVHALDSETKEWEKIPGSIETGRWYDIRIELDGPWVRCYLDGKKIQEHKRIRPEEIFATAGKSANGSELIVKLVNTIDKARDIDIQVQGNAEFGPRGRAIVLGGLAPEAENSFSHPTLLEPQENKIKSPAKRFTRKLPPQSVTILRLPLQ
jgi:alpha-L-arabinofuranosidase